MARTSGWRDFFPRRENDLSSGNRIQSWGDRRTPSLQTTRLSLRRVSRTDRSVRPHRAPTEPVLSSEAASEDHVGRRTTLSRVATWLRGSIRRLAAHFSARAICQDDLPTGRRASCFTCSRYLRTSAWQEGKCARALPHTAARHRRPRRSLLARRNTRSSSRRARRC